MTTVAYRDGVLASDGRLSIGKEWVENDTARKLYPLADGSVVGIAGNSYQWTELVKRLKKLAKSEEKKLPNSKDFSRCEALLVCPNKDIYYLGMGSGWSKLKNRPTAIGSGWQFAMCAMDAGADAATACRIAIKRDMYSGGKVKTIKVF